MTTHIHTGPEDDLIRCACGALWRFVACERCGRSVRVLADVPRKYCEDCQAVMDRAWKTASQKRYKLRRALQQAGKPIPPYLRRRPRGTRRST